MWKEPSTTMQTAAKAIQPTQGEALGYLCADGLAACRSSGWELIVFPSQQVVVVPRCPQPCTPASPAADDAVRPWAAERVRRQDPVPGASDTHRCKGGVAGGRYGARGMQR